MMNLTVENNDLISRSAAIKTLREWAHRSLTEEDRARLTTVVGMLENQPAVDAVPVRCGGCINYGYRNRHWDDIGLKNEPKGCRKWLDKTGMFIISDSNAFCSYGERKCDDNENY